MGDERGQASLEVVAGVPLLVLAALACLQLFATGYALSLADGAAEAGALALASGEPPEAAVERALPGWASERVEIDEDGGELTVRLRPPAPLGALAEALEVNSSAWVRTPSESP